MRVVVQSWFEDVERSVTRDEADRRYNTHLMTRSTTDQRLVSARFPRSSAYHPDWVIGSASGGANALWLAEWLADGLELKPGLRVLDSGLRPCNIVDLPPA